MSLGSVINSNPIGDLDREIMTVEERDQIFEDPPEDEEEEEEDDDEDEEDLVDPRDEVVEKCGEHCTALKAELEACSDRVNSRPGTEETCEQELFDFLHCVDHCTAPKTLDLYK